MKLSRLLCGMNYTLLQGSPEDCEVSGLCEDSRRIKQGDLFFCRTGNTGSGCDYLREALSRGAGAVVGAFFRQQDKDLLAESQVTVIETKELHAQARLADHFYDHPQSKIHITGVTGTKGKTTVCTLYAAVLKSNGISCSLSGTNGCQIGSTCRRTSYTTPELFELYAFMAESLAAGCTHCVIEVSSLAVKQGRIDGIQFDLGIFTNLYPDHISSTEHADMEEYGSWKISFLTRCSSVLLNRDDPFSETIAPVLKPAGSLLYYSVRQEADSYAQAITQKLTGRLFGSSFVWHYRGEQCREITLSLPGIANVSNAVAAITAASLVVPDVQKLKIELSGIIVRGRFEVAAVVRGGYVIIDYAHNESSLKQLLLTVRSYHPNRIICMFGCGGNRSPVRRGSMGRVSTLYADLTIITQDNSRGETFQDILRDILKGVEPDREYIVIADRKEAIRYCLDIIKPGDVVVLAGKGHEETQTIGNVTYPLSEKRIVDDYIAKAREKTDVMPEGK